MGWFSLKGWDEGGFQCEGGVAEVGFSVKGRGEGRAQREGGCGGGAQQQNVHLETRECAHMTLILA